MFIVVGWITMVIDFVSFGVLKVNGMFGEHAFRAIAVWTAGMEAQQKTNNDQTKQQMEIQHEVTAKETDIGMS